MDDDYGKPTPLRLSAEMDAQIAYAAKRLKMSKQEVIRLSIAIGLEDLRTIDYSLARAIVTAAKSEARVRDGDVKYKAEKKPGA